MVRRWTMSLWAAMGVVFYLVLVARLFSIQVMQRDAFIKQSERQASGSVSVNPKRGVIYDRNFRQLAVNVMQYSLGVNPRNIKDPQRLAKTCAEHLGNSPGYYRKLFRGDRFVYLARAMDRETFDKFDLKEFRELVADPAFGRYYPFRKAAAHVLGFTNIDYVGLTGLEAKYEEFLRGKPGYIAVNYDANGDEIPVLGKPIQEPLDGHSLVLSLDINCQLIAEEELETGVKKYGARAGMVVMMDPFSGEVISLASYPDFDPNTFMAFKGSERKNRTITDPFEPGSTYKLVVAAAALDREVFNPADVVFCGNGRDMFPGGWINDHKPFGDLTFKEVFSHSSNVGMAKIGQMLGKKWIYEYSRAFGFGSDTGIDFLGEERGKLENHAKWSASDAARIPLGYGIMATAMQITNAYAAVANGGYLMKPRLLKAVIEDETRRVVYETKPDTIRKVINPETVAILKSFMSEVVLHGTGTEASVRGTSVAGKTGTTKKFDAEIGRYSDKKYMASFVGFSPVENSRYVCLVVLDEPKLPYNYGGHSAAPIFSNILRRITALVSTGSRSVRIAKEAPNLPVPGVTKYPIKTAISILEDYGFQAEVIGEGDVVDAQHPLPKTLISPGATVTLRVKSGSKSGKNTRKIPDVRGMTIRQAVLILTQSGFQPTLEGSGIVVDQFPAANTVARNEDCKLICFPSSG